MKLTNGPRSFARPTSRRSDPRDPGEMFRNVHSAKMTAHGTSETSRHDPAKRHRFENADMRLAWWSCRRISSATRGKKVHFCAPNHVLLPFGRRRFRWRRLPMWDEIIPLPSKLRGYFFDPYA